MATEIGRKCAALKDTQGRVPAHLAAMSSRRDLVELLLPHSGLGSDVGLDAVMARGKVTILKVDKIQNTNCPGCSKKYGWHLLCLV